MGNTEQYLVSSPHRQNNEAQSKGKASNNCLMQQMHFPVDKPTRTEPKNKLLNERSSRKSAAPSNNPPMKTPFPGRIPEHSNCLCKDNIRSSPPNPFNIAYYLCRMENTLFFFANLGHTSEKPLPICSGLRGS